MERRRLAGMKPDFLFHHRKIKKFKNLLKNEKEPQDQQLANLVFEDLAQKRRNRVIVVRKNFMEVAFSARMCRACHEIFSCPFGHFVVEKEFLGYPSSLALYIPKEILAGLLYS
jgi:hypothetical protein